jgi:hypothetical protein
MGSLEPGLILQPLNGEVDGLAVKVLAVGIRAHGLV